MSPSDEARVLIRCTEVPVRSSLGQYAVRVGAGVRGLLPAAIEAAAPAGRCALISDRTVARLWYEEIAAILDRNALDVVEALFPAGEASKTRETWTRLTDVLLN
ncbi:MAG: 3-dehydroquinate synthase, partial [Gemmatimonadetes bacterium]|nr:3-dehydroquinate synthase [Gemmatimonadota bacterium]